MNVIIALLMGIAFGGMGAYIYLNETKKKAK